MNWKDWTSWWNLIFLVPLALGAVLAALAVFGAGDNDGDFDGDFDGDDSDLDSDDDDNGALGKVLAALHLSGLPPTLILQNLLLFWGVLGWSANLMLNAADARVLLISLPLALVGGLVLTALASRFLSRFMPKGETAAVKAHDLAGRLGETASLVSATGGAVYVRDQFGTLHQVAARLPENSEPESSIPSGRKVLVVSYEEEHQIYRVKVWQETES